MKTKISLMLLALGLACSSAYAAHAEETPMPVSNDINVTAPDQPGSWSLGATALLLQPLSQFNYADMSPATVTTNASNVSNIQSVNSGYHWWFGANITYHFPGNGRDVTVAYEGLHGNSSDNVASAAGNITNPDTFNIFGTNYTGAQGTVDTAYDAADLLFGQKLDVGSRVSLHPFAGLRYAHINVDNKGSYSNPAEAVFNGGGAQIGTDPVAEYSQINSTFNGIGPRFGSDAQVNLGDGFSIRGRLGLSALMGSLSADVNSTLVDTGTLTPGTTYVANNTNSQTHVVPELDGRLGVNYTYDFNTSMALGMEAGWQAENYFNAVLSTTAITSDSNFALQGPYARLQLDVA